MRRELGIAIVGVVVGATGLLVGAISLVKASDDKHPPSAPTATGPGSAAAAELSAKPVPPSESTTSDPARVTQQVYEQTKAKLPPHELACFPLGQLVCGDGACESGPAKVFALLATKPAVALSRCDAAGCDTYEAVASASGAFVNVQPQAPRGMLLKVDLGKMRYVEVTTLETRVLVNYGSCRDVAR